MEKRRATHVGFSTEEEEACRPYFVSFMCILSPCHFGGNSPNV